MQKASPLWPAVFAGDPWSKSCLHTKACFGWDTPYSFNRTCWYEVSYIHPRVKQPLGERLGRAALDLHCAAAGKKPRSFFALTLHHQDR